MDNKEIDDIIAILDRQVNNEVSRIKINVDDSDSVAAGEYKREYHHGRCDVGSPWAKGLAFDVLE